MYHNKRNRTKTLFASLIAVVALAGGAFVVHNHQVQTGTSTSGSHKFQQDKHLAPNSIHKQHGLISAAERPLSRNHPVLDLKVLGLKRPDFSSPNINLFDASVSSQALPTNAWYQNLLLVHGQNPEPTEEQRVYPVPYVVDMVGPIPGMRLHMPQVVGGATVIQLTQVLAHGLTLGATTRKSLVQPGDEEASNKAYKIVKMTPLGITLEWVRFKIMSRSTHVFILISSCAWVSLFGFNSFFYRLIKMRIYFSKSH